MTRCHPCTTIPYAQVAMLGMKCRPGMEHLDQALAMGVRVPAFGANKHVELGAGLRYTDPWANMIRPGTLSPRTSRIPGDVQIPIGASFTDEHFHDVMQTHFERRGPTGSRFVVTPKSYPSDFVAAKVTYDRVPGVMNVLATMSARERVPSDGITVSHPPGLPVPVVGIPRAQNAPLPRPSIPGTPRYVGTPEAGGLVMGRVFTPTSRTSAMSARPSAMTYSGGTHGGWVQSPFPRVTTLAGEPMQHKETNPANGRVDVDDESLERAFLINTWVWTGIGALTLVGLMAKRRRR